MNDSHGHAVGDEVLVQAAARLLGAVRSCDRVGRVGGDEFLVVCPHVASMNQASRVAGRLTRALSGPLAIGGRLLDVRASVGLAWSGERGVASEAFVRVADAAMYQSKARGGGAVCVEVDSVGEPIAELVSGDDELVAGGGPDSATGARERAGEGEAKRPARL